MYFITSIKHPDDVDIIKFPGTTDARCWGYYFDRAVALAAVDLNIGDMNEGYYNWIVVEDITDHVNPKMIEDIWFKWDDGLEQWVHADKPTWTQHIQKWAIG